MNGNIAVIAYGWHGVDVIDISDIQNPISIAEHDTPYFAYDVGANQSFLFVADYYSLLRFLPPNLSGIDDNEDSVQGLPTEIELYPNFPNPFNASTVIRFYVPKRSQVSLEVFNILGQSVAVLVDENQETGLHCVRYTPTESEHDLASGIYVYTLKVDESILSRQMIFVK